MPAAAMSHLPELRSAPDLMLSNGVSTISCSTPSFLATRSISVDVEPDDLAGVLRLERRVRQVRAGGELARLDQRHACGRGSPAGGTGAATRTAGVAGRTGAAGGETEGGRSRDDDEGTGCEARSHRGALLVRAPDRPRHSKRNHGTRGVPVGYLPGYNGIPSRRGHGRRHQIRRPADVERRPAPVRADRPAARDGAGGVCVGAALRGGLRRGGRPPATCAPWTTSPGSRSPPRTTCGSSTRSGCSPCRARRSSGSTPAWHDRPAHRRGVHPGRPRRVVGGHGEVDPRGRWTAGRYRPRGLRYGLFTGGLGAHYGAERLGCTVVPVSGGMTERQVQLIRDFEPRVIMVTPATSSAFRRDGRQGLDPRQSSLRIGIFGAEPWTESMRREVEERTSMDAVDIYGLSEVIGPGVAQEAVDQGRAARLGGPLLPGDRRPHHRRAGPGRRAAVSWSSPASPSRPCRCCATARGTSTRLLPGTAYPAFRRMEKITGRSDDMMIVRGVNVFPTQVEELVLAGPRWRRTSSAC